MSLLLSLSNYSYVRWSEKFPDHNVDLKKLNVHHSWDEFMSAEYEKEHFERINAFLSSCLSKTDGKIEIYPYPDLLFNALNLTHLDQIKVVILGQDPYHEPKQAMGLSFSVPVDVPVPPSLQNIYKNLIKNNEMFKMPKHGNLEFWAHQGCLLLNTSLTVQRSYAGGHMGYWKEFTDTLIKYISNNTNNIVFILWGGPALDKLKLINESKHKVLVSSHPSGLSCNSTLRGHNSFTESNNFKKANDYLISKNKEPIVWSIV